MKCFVLLAGSAVLALALAAYPAWAVDGQRGLLQGGAAMLLSSLPALGTMAWALRPGQAPEHQLVAILGGTGVRMAVVLAGGFLLNWAWPDWFNDNFWIWLGAFYLYTLTVETILVFGQKSRAAS